MRVTGQGRIFLTANGNRIIQKRFFPIRNRSCSIFPVDLTGHSQICNILSWRRVDANGSVKTRVIEEVKVGSRILGLWRSSQIAAQHIAYHPDRQGCIVNKIIDCHGQKVILSLPQVIRNFHFKGKKASLMLCDQPPVQIDIGMMGRRVKTQHDSLPCQKGRK